MADRTPADIAADLDELGLLWPALADALERDHRPDNGDKVSSSGGSIGLPVNLDVLKAVAVLAGEIPATAWWCCQILGEPHNAQRDIPDHLRHFPRMHERLRATNAASDAASLANTIRRWRDAAKTAIGLRIPDRRLPQFCPTHDDPLSQLVTPGDEGWLTATRGGYTVTWRHTEAVLCRHCGTTWTPGQYLLLGRLLKDADRRRLAMGSAA